MARLDVRQVDAASVPEEKHGHHPKMVTLPADLKMLDAMEVGTEVEVVLRGKLIEKVEVPEDGDSEGALFRNPTCDVELSSVEAYPVDNEFGELADEQRS